MGRRFRNVVVNWKPEGVMDLIQKTIIRGPFEVHSIYYLLLLEPAHISLKSREVAHSNTSKHPFVEFIELIDIWQH